MIKQMKGERIMYEVAEILEAGKAQDVIKAEPKEIGTDENGQLFRPDAFDEDE
jgi:hypothetical protein